jgi:hypothetical protein
MMAATLRIASNVDATTLVSTLPERYNLHSYRATLVKK